MRHPNVVNEREQEWIEDSHGEKFGYLRKRLASATGGDKLGCSLYEVPPGRRAWPRHYHLANEEAVYILSGSGTLRIGDEEVGISEGDYITFPAGERTAHQIINSSGEALRYLCFSTMIAPEVTIYPDSNKVGLMAGSAPGGSKEKRTLSKVLRGDAEAGYFDGE